MKANLFRIVPKGGVPYFEILRIDEFNHEDHLRAAMALEVRRLAAESNTSTVIATTEDDRVLILKPEEVFNGSLRDAAKALIAELEARTYTTITEPHPQASFVGGRVCSIKTLNALKEMCKD